MERQRQHSRLYQNKRQEVLKMILDLKEIKSSFEVAIDPYILEDGTPISVDVEAENMEDDYLVLKRQDRFLKSKYEAFCIVNLTNNTITYLPEVADYETVEATYKAISELLEDINPSRFRTRDAIQASRF